MLLKDVVKSYILCLKSRMVVLFVYTWAAGISLLLTGAPLSLIVILKTLLAVTFVSYGIYFYNDIMDLEDDLKNKELGNPIPASRPLGRGLVSKKRMALYASISSIFGLTLSYLINMQVFLLQLIYIFMGILYSTEPIKLKKRFLLKQLTMASGLAISHLTGGFALGIINLPIIYITILNAALAVGVSPIMDLRDISGDKKIGIKTFPVVWGPELTIRLAIGVLISSEIATIVGYSRIGFNISMPILFTVIVVTLIYVISPLIKKWNDPYYLNVTLHKKVIPLLQLLQLTAVIGIIKFYI